MNTKVVIGIIIIFYFINRISSLHVSINISSTGIGCNISRVVNGEIAPEGSFQYQVLLSIKKSGKILRCGGAILDRKHVITAARCLAYKPRIKSSSVRVRGGSVNYNSGEIRMFKVRSIKVHPSYDTKSGDYDVAVLKISTKFPFDVRGFKPIKLATELMPDNTRCVLSGWGTFEPMDNVVLDHLFYAHLYHVDSENCSNLLYSMDITSRMICFAYKARPTDTCVGDSGGPLVCKGLLVGLVSWSTDYCTLKDNPGVYSSISSLRSWILQKIS